MNFFRGMAGIPGATLAAVAVVALHSSAAAGEVADLASQAETLLEADEPTTAFDAMDAAVDAFWRAAPLIIEEARFDPAPDSDTFPPRSEVAIHLRPLGYGFLAEDGENRIALDADLEIRTPGGLILAKSDGFGRLEWKGVGENRNFAGRISVAMPETIKPGSYELRLTLTDAATQKDATVVLPFSIAAE